MALVNLLKFDDYSGAMICDEEYWLLRQRRSYFSDYIYSLIPEEIANQLHLEVIYGGVGTPSLTYEVVEKTKVCIKEKFDKLVEENKGGLFSITVEEVAKIVLEVIRKAFRKRADSKLKFLYGFDTDSLNRGFYEIDGVKYDIKQDAIKENALKIAVGGEKGSSLQFFFEHQGIILGFDKNKGLTSYSFKHEDFVLYPTAGPIETIGQGKDVAQVILADYLNRKNLEARRKGFNHIEGMIELIKSAYFASIHNHEVGGYFHILYLNGKGKTQKERIKEILDERAKLAEEVVIAFINDELTFEDTYYFIDELIFKEGCIDEIERKFLNQAKNLDRLGWILRGYKKDSLPSSACFSEEFKRRLQR